MRTLKRKSTTGGPAEAGYYPALVETARVVNVNVRDWSVDCVGEYGEKRFFDIQVMSPYMHYANGEGMYVMPEVGAICWICTPSAGSMAQPFVLGWQAPIDERDDVDTEAPAVNFRANRQSLNPGDMMMKTRDENFLILRRGGVVQVGATPIAQRFYIPLKNLIRDVCENYRMESLAGEMEFTVQRAEEDTDGNQLTYFEHRTKLKANEPSHAVVLRTGSHADDDSLRLTLVVNSDGEEGSPSVAQLSVDKDGTVTWDVEKDWTQTVKGNFTLTVEEGDMLAEAVAGKMDLKSGGDMSFETSANLDMTAAGSLSATAADATVTASSISLKGMTQVGGPGGEPVVLGLQLVTFLTEVLTKLVSGDAGPSTPPGLPQAFPALASEIPKLQKILSLNNTTT